MYVIEDLYQRLQEHIPLEWLAGHSIGSRPWDDVDARASRVCPVGNLNLIHTNRIQVVGEIELAYLQQLDEATRGHLTQKLFTGDTRIIILTDNIDPPGKFLQQCRQTPVALFRTPEGNFNLTTELRHILADDLAEKTSLHGVFLEVTGIGLLLSGEAGAGKSELALELISRGHRLIADDAPLLTRITSSAISGSCPALLQDFLEVRGLGILNIRAMFGDSAIKLKKTLRLLVQLTPYDAISARDDERLEGICSTREVLGISIPEITLPVAPGRNLAVLVEAAARNHLLRINGYNAATELQSRLQQQLKSPQR